MSDQEMSEVWERVTAGSIACYVVAFELVVSDIYGRRMDHYYGRLSVPSEHSSPIG